jgi:polygalacturonase
MFLFRTLWVGIFPITVNDAYKVHVMKYTHRFLYLLFFILIGCGAGAQTSSAPWNRMDSIVARIHPPVFRDAEYLLTDFGATPGENCSEAFQKAIERCSREGGGRVVVPRGEFLTGPVRLRKNVDLHLSEGAVLKFERDPAKYLPLVLTRWEGVECMNYSPFIYAYGEENIAVTGRGTLDGQGSNKYWWPWKGTSESGWKEGMPNQLEGRKRLFEMGEKGVPVGERKFGDGFYLRPNFLQPYKCTNVLIDGVKIINSPMWEIHPVLCANVIVQNVVIDSHGPNNDGCNPESCRDVLIRNCQFDTGDDCIAIKSGRNNDGRRVNVPSENIVIQRCKFKDGHGGVTIGSEISGSARNIFAEECEMNSPVLYSALRLKSNAVRGGTIENVYLRKIMVGLVGRAVVDIDLQYEEGEHGGFLPTIQEIEIDGMIVEKCKVPMHLVGYARKPIRNIRLKNCEFKNAAKGYEIEYVEGFQTENTRVNGKELLTKEIPHGGND